LEIEFEENDFHDLSPERARSVESLIREVVSRVAPPGPVLCHIARDLRDPARARIRLGGPGWLSFGALGLPPLPTAREAIAGLVPGRARGGPPATLAREWTAAMGSTLLLRTV